MLPTPLPVSAKSVYLSKQTTGLFDETYLRGHCADSHWVYFYPLMCSCQNTRSAVPLCNTGLTSDCCFSHHLACLFSPLFRSCKHTGGFGRTFQRLWRVFIFSWARSRITTQTWAVLKHTSLIFQKALLANATICFLDTKAGLHPARSHQGQNELMSACIHSCRCSRKGRRI